MVEARHVRSNCIDIRKKVSPLPKTLVLDANVLYWSFYPNFSQLAAAGSQRQPLAYQIGEYPKWIKAVLKANTQLLASVITVGEFADLIEYAELETLWVSDPNKAGQVFHRKQARMDYEAQPVRQRVNTIIESVRKTVTLLPAVRPEPQDLDKCLAEWIDAFADFKDAALAAHAKFPKMSDVLTDDADLLTFDGLTVYTANNSAIDAARSAGKLLN